MPAYISRISAAHVSIARLLQRNGYAPHQIAALREAHRTLFRSRRPRAEILDELESNPAMTAEVAELCTFLRRVELGHQGRSREL